MRKVVAPLSRGCRQCLTLNVADVSLCREGGGFLGAIYGGVIADTIADRLGHTTTRLTLDRYGHLLPGMQEEAADRLDGLLGAANEKSPP